MKLFMIHGRGQEGKDPSALKDVWVNSWVQGLSKNGLEIPENVDIQFLYYGDLLDSLIKEENESRNRSDIQLKGNEFDEDETVFMLSFYQEIAKNAQINKALVDIEMPSGFIEKGFENTKLIIALAKAIDKHTALSESVLKVRTRDVYSYLKFKLIQNRINDQIMDSLSEEPCVVLAHSLGTVVAYNVLQSNKNLSVNKFITLGSPLSVSIIKSYLKKPLEVPSCILNGNWFNAFDKRDIVALRPLDKQNFNVLPPVVNYDAIDNQTSNRHGIEGYLSDIIVAKEIYNGLLSL